VKEEEAIARKPWQPCAEANWFSSQVKRRFAVELGKMLQNGPLNALDQEVPYLKAQHVQWDGVRLDELPTMWASPTDIENLRISVGDLLVCEGGEVGRAAMLQEASPTDCIVQNALHRVRPHLDDEARFLGYLLRHAATQGWFDVLCNRSTIAHFTVDKFGEMWIALPDAKRQRSIANYLDRETARLDRLVAAKERVLRLLGEKRRALITRVVTRGLDPGAPLRDSDKAWLGKIPAHWELERARWLFRERDERSETGEEELLTVSHLTGITPRSEKDVSMFEAATTEGYKVCYAGDLVINTLWAWMGAMGVSRVNGIVSPAYNVYVACERLEPAYVDALVQVPVFAEEATRYSKGVWVFALASLSRGLLRDMAPRSAN
jgi:type I restriction enzyme, S subunit